MMLFISMSKVKAGKFEEIVARRAKWEYPRGMRVLAEYWPIGGEYAVIAIVEGEDIAPAMATVAAWSDVLDTTITPAVTAEEGLRLAQQIVKR
jgi:uncharacterized protein with GYD domain